MLIVARLSPRISLRHGLKRPHTNFNSRSIARTASMSSPSTSAVVDKSSADTKYSYHPPRPRKFAPLRGESESDEGLPRLKGIVFDVDGTLCLPQNYMFQKMRDALGITKGVDLLEHVRSLSEQPDGQPHRLPDDYKEVGESSPRSRANAAIKSIEREAMTSQTPQPGLVELMTYLSSRRILVGLCTRNFPAPVEHLVDKFLRPSGVMFREEEIVTRDTKGVEPKPSPEGIWKIAKYWVQEYGMEEKEAGGNGVSEGQGGGMDVLDAARRYLGAGLIMVGDSEDDMAAGYRAGAATVLLLNEDNESLKDHEFTDLAVRRLDELIDVLEQGFVGNVSM